MLPLALQNHSSKTLFTSHYSLELAITAAKTMLHHKTPKTLAVSALVLLALFTVHTNGQSTNATSADASTQDVVSVVAQPSQLSAAAIAAKCSASDELNKCQSNVKASEKLLSRRKRYVAFPEGSSFSVAFCETLGFVGNPQFIYFSWAINWGIAYELPNQTWIINNRNRKLLPKQLVKRRHRRDLYNKLEIAIDNMGYNGRGCILRALCESTQYFYKKGANMVEELVRTVFTLPDMKVLPFEHTDLVDYDAAFRKGKEKVFCPAVYPECSFSLIEMALGEYSSPFNYM